MKHVLALSLAATMLVLIAFGDRADADPFHRGMTRNDYRAARHAARVPWHAPYNHTEWGRPLALVVPPTANVQTNWGWGVGGTRLSPIFHQFGRTHYPGPGYGVGPPYMTTPGWPSDTTQFGSYYIRGPW